MSNTAQDLTYKCGAMLSEHSIDGQYDGGCARTGCHYFEEAKTPPKKDSIAQLRKERDAWRELAQARGRVIVAVADKDNAAFEAASPKAHQAAKRLRKLGIPEEQLQ